MAFVNKLRTSRPLQLSIIIACALIIAVLAVMYHIITSNYSAYKYAVAIDAGSTNSQLNLYRWPSEKHKGTAVLELVAKPCDVEKVCV